MICAITSKGIAQQKGDSLKISNIKNVKKETFEINGKIVDGKVFKSFLNTLKGMPHTEIYCKEIEVNRKTGSETVRTITDTITGIEYRYILQSINGNQKNIITKEDNFKKVRGETYEIEGKKVPKEAFERFLATLKEVKAPGTWDCVETFKDGETGYEKRSFLEDKYGVVYEYTDYASVRKFTASIRKKIL